MSRQSCNRMGWFIFLPIAMLIIKGSPALADEWGPQVGTKAHGFKLKNQANEEVSLQALLRTGPVAIIFYRSASW